MSISRGEIINIADSFGFRLCSTVTGQDGTVYNFVDNYGIHLKVDSKNHFSLYYFVPKTVFEFVCPDCSPFSDKNHFSKFYSRFKDEVIGCWKPLYRVSV